MRAAGLEGTEVLLIDGNNLLHRVARGAEPELQRALLARLRLAIPQSVPTIVMLDGHTVPGTGAREHVAGNFEVRHAGSVSADDAIVALVEQRPVTQRHAVLLVTDDRALTERVRTLGARTQRLRWLEAILDNPPRPQRGSAIGCRSRPPVAAPAAEAEDRQPWTPGRGATRKRGNPRRRAR